MRLTALLLALSWFWLLFYGVGPLNSAGQLALGGGALAAVCAAGALLGALRPSRRARAQAAGVGASPRSPR